MEKGVRNTGCMLLLDIRIKKIIILHSPRSLIIINAGEKTGVIQCYSVFANILVPQFRFFSDEFTHHPDTFFIIQDYQIHSP